jgi:hypothetical protein
VIAARNEAKSRRRYRWAEFHITILAAIEGDQKSDIGLDGGAMEKVSLAIPGQTAVHLPSF